ncbi:MAG TPA: hypothetical protein VMB26_10245 [Candidatus Binataceae bacterium]|nr:hypothetical protein [Candidatus Binataceae bacterium]
MKKNIAMGLGGVAAILLDYLAVALIVILLAVMRRDGVGWTLDVMTVLLVSYGIFAWFCGKRLSHFLSHYDDNSSLTF